MLHWLVMVSVTMRPTMQIATMIVGTVVLKIRAQITVMIVAAICQRLVLLDGIHWSEMDFAMMKQMWLNVNMTVVTVVQILTWLVMPYVMMKLTILDAIMMVETVV